MTSNELFAKAHQIARRSRGQYRSYREAFAAGLGIARRMHKVVRADGRVVTVCVPE